MMPVRLTFAASQLTVTEYPNTSPLPPPRYFTATWPVVEPTFRLSGSGSHTTFSPPVLPIQGS